MTYNALVSQIHEKKSFLCVGLDTDAGKIPPHLKLQEMGRWQFNKAIIDATAPYCVAFKPNLAFYEAMGEPGYQLLASTAEYIKTKYPEILLIADAKRGDIGNTAKAYAQALFRKLPFDAVTLSPYMGSDTIAPFLEYPDKWAIVLALTSNPSASDFQHNGTPPLYQQVLERTQQLGSPENLMFVTGATQASYLSEIRKIVPQHFLLVPGVGAQGGSLDNVAKHGLNKDCGLLVNSSRGILYAGNGKDFAAEATNAAKSLQQQMAAWLA